MPFLFGMLISAALVVAAHLAWRSCIGFAAQRPEDYAFQHPAFDPRVHLNGRFHCEGVVFGPAGRLSTRFAADVEASWEGDRGLVVEEFRYDSGATQRRELSLAFLEDGSIRADGEDVVGAIEAAVAGSALRLAYRARLPGPAGGQVVSIIDWMYLLENGTIVNRSQFRKLGFTVAEVVATFRPTGAGLADRGCGAPASGA